MRNWLWYAFSVCASTLLLAWLGLSTRQVLAVAGFSAVLFGAIFFWERRLIFAFLGVAGLLATNLLDVPHLVEFAGLDIIVFLIAMMIVVGFLEEKEFFEHLIDRLLLTVGPHPKQIMVLLMIVACIAAALVDEVTSILFMVAAMLNLIERSDLKPGPYVMMLVFTTNVGSSATAVGNPIGVIIALRSGFTFLDFLRWATPISAAVAALTIILCLWLFRHDIKRLKPVLAGRRGERTLERVAEMDHSTRRGLRQSGWLFGLTIVGLVLHHPIEEWLHLPRNTMLLGVALIGAGVALLLAGSEARKLVEKRVQWWVLAFFLFLFAAVGTLKYTGVTTVMAQRLVGLAHGDVGILTTLFAWASGFLTSVMDNVLAVATFVPIVGDVAAAGLPTAPLWWAMLMGGTIMGNATLIGSTANMVAADKLEQAGKPPLTFAQWLLPGMIVGVLGLLLANALVLLQMPLMPR